MNNILTNIKDRNMSISLNDVTFFMTCDNKNFFIAPVLINKDSTKAKDLRTSRIYDIKENENGSKDMWGLFLSVMKKYDKNIENNFDVAKLFYVQEFFSYRQFFHKFFQEPYAIFNIIGAPANFTSRFFKSHNVCCSQDLLATKKDVVKLCDSIQHTHKKVLENKSIHNEQKSESQKNREF